MASSEKCRCRASLPFRSCWRRDGTSATCCTRTRSADRTSPPFDESPDPPRIGVSRTSSPKQGSLKARDIESPSANYEELVKTQSVLNRKHLGVAAPHHGGARPGARAARSDELHPHALEIRKRLLARPAVQRSLQAAEVLDAPAGGARRCAAPYPGSLHPPPVAGPQGRCGVRSLTPEIYSDVLKAPW